MVTGEYSETPAGAEGTWEIKAAGKLDGISVPDFNTPGEFYEFGFEWHPDRVRWFMIVDGKELTLWNMTDKALVPQGKARFLINVWHPATQWWTNTPADYPAQDAVLRIDRVQIWQN